MPVRVVTNDNGKLEIEGFREGEGLFWYIAADHHGFCGPLESDQDCYRLYLALYDAANMYDSCPRGEVTYEGEVIGTLVAGAFEPVGKFCDRVKNQLKEEFE